MGFFESVYVSDTVQILSSDISSIFIQIKKKKNIMLERNRMNKHFEPRIVINSFKKKKKSAAQHHKGSHKIEKAIEIISITFNMITWIWHE